jgi:hypothetical protein
LNIDYNIVIFSNVLERNISNMLCALTEQQPKKNEESKN